jgi:hypothetical protein
MRVRSAMIVGAAAALALAGCGEATNATNPTDASARASSAPTSTAAAPGAASAEGVCTSTQLRPELTLQPSSSQRALLALTNTSKATCTLEGWAKVTLHNAADEAVPVSTSQVNQPGPPVKVELLPGRTAFAGLKWAPCDKADEACGVGNSLTVTPPGGTAKYATLLEFPKPEASGITMASLQLGTIQPSAQGVVAW